MLPRYDSAVFRTTGGVPYLKGAGVVMTGRTITDLSGTQDFLSGFDVGDSADPDHPPQVMGCPVEPSQFSEYLKDPDTLAHGTQLIKFAGQLCYLSFGPKRTWNKDAETYIKNILEQRHGCYDAATDVLTSNGWKSWPDVTIDDHLATLARDGSLTYRRPVAVQAFDYAGKMYRVEAQGVDLLVTPNHRMYVCPTTTKAGRKKASFSLIEAKDLGTISHAYTKIAATWAPAESYPWSINLLRFLGFAIGDGSYTNGMTVHFHLRRPRKVTWLKSVISLLMAEEEGEWGLNLYGEDCYTVHISRQCRDLVQKMYQNGEKCIPQHVLTSARREALEGLLEGLMQSDGSEGETGDSFDTTSPLLADQVQQLCLHVGIAANVCYTYGPEQRSSSFGTKPLTRLSILSRSLRPEVNKFSGAVGRSYWVENWAGEVFCAQMPDDTQHVLYVRRNGKPVWCGNSVLEHVSYSFLIYGVSRSFTHELVRHRLASYSQVSQRYVDGKVLRFVERPEYQNDDFLHSRFCRRIEAAYVEYRELAEYLANKLAGPADNNWPEEEQKAWRKKRRDFRKLVNQAARSCLPNETEAPIVFTANVRSLRHILEMRAAGPAEVEIRRATYMIYQCLMQADPILFADYVEEKLADGTVALSTPYRKV